MKIFVPFDEALVDSLGEGELEKLGALVPFQLDYPKTGMGPSIAGMEDWSDDQMGWLEVVVG